MLNFCEWCKIGSNFILFQVDIQFSHHHLLKRLSFPHRLFLAPLSNISWPYMCGFISRISVLFYWGIFLHYLLWKPGWVPGSEFHKIVSSLSPGPLEVFNSKSCPHWAFSKLSITIPVFLCWQWVLWVVLVSLCFGKPWLSIFACLSLLCCWQQFSLCPPLLQIQEELLIFQCVQTFCSLRQIGDFQAPYMQN